MAGDMLLVALGRSRLPGILEISAKHAFVVFGTMDGVAGNRIVFSNNQLVGLGRPILYGLAAAGVDGVRDVIQEITSELLRLMSMTGAQDPWHVSRDLFDQGMTASPSARII